VLLLALEYALGGSLAAGLGSLFAYALAFGFTQQLLDLKASPLSKNDPAVLSKNDPPVVHGAAVAT
jgi:hypothetical protein